MRRSRKYRFLPDTARLGVLATVLIVGCIPEGGRKDTAYFAGPMADGGFAMSAVREEINRLDSLWDAGDAVAMESGLQRLLQLENERSERLDAGEFAWLNDWLGEFHYRLGNLTDAKHYSELAISRLDSVVDIDFKTHVWNNRAIIESDLGNYELALALLFKSMEAYGTDTMNRSFIDFYNNIGGVYRASKNDDLAIHYFEKQITLAKHLGLEDEFGYYHGNLGYMYYSRGEFERSISHLQEAKASFANFGQLDNQSLINTLLASNYIALGRVDDADSLLQGNLEVTAHRQQWEAYVETAISLFELYIAKGNPQAAFAAIERGLERIHVTNTGRLQLKLYDRLLDYHRAEGDFQSAFGYLRRRTDIQDSLIDASKNEVMREFSVKYESDRKSDQIARLAELNSEERRTKVIYLIGLVFLIGVLLLIFLLLRRISMQKRALEVSNRTKDKLFSIIAHDLRSPMIALRGMGDLLNHYIGNNDEQKLSGLAAKAGKTLTHINHLLDNLLNWAVTNSDRIAYHPLMQDVSQLVEEALTVHKAGVEAKQLKLIVELAPANIFVDIHMAASMLRNVISNAIKHSPDGATVTITGSDQVGYYIIRIRDEGEGIPKDVISRLHLQQFTTVSGGGTGSFGLGLQLAMHFAKENKGKLVIDDTPEKGALLEIWLPLAAMEVSTG